MRTIHHPKAGSTGYTIRALLLIALVLFCAVGASAQSLPDVNAMSVEDLMNVQVTRPAPRIQNARTQVGRIQGPDGEELLARSSEVFRIVRAGIHSMYSPRR